MIEQAKKEMSPHQNISKAAEILQEKRDFIYAVIRSNGCEQETEDIFQNIFLSLATTPIPEHIENVNSYLYRTVINDIIDISRKTNAYRGKLDRFRRQCLKHYSTDFIQTIIIKEEFSEILCIVETKFPSYLRVPFCMRYKQEYTITEISQKLGVKKNVVSVYLSDGLRMLREIIGIERGYENCF